MNVNEKESKKVRKTVMMDDDVLEFVHRTAHDKQSESALIMRLARAGMFKVFHKKPIECTCGCTYSAMLPNCPYCKRLAPDVIREPKVI
jgi:hypothetical protein